MADKAGSGTHAMARNDRVQTQQNRRTPQPNTHAPPKLTPAQRRARGPLPDWDDIQKQLDEGGEDNIDYMKMMDDLYAGYFATTAVPAYEGMSNIDPGEATRMIDEAKEHMARIGIRPAESLEDTVIFVPAENDGAFRPESMAVPSPPPSPAPMSPALFVSMSANQSPLMSPVPPPDPTILTDEKLKDYVRKQVEYYFSAINLRKDIFLRKQMSPEGYLPLTLIASFPRVKSLTRDVGLIVEGLRESEMVELSLAEDAVRPRVDPKAWPLLTPALDTK